MDQSEQIQFLNHQLLADMPQYKRDAQSFPQSQAEQRRLLRSLMNLRPPMMLTEEFIKAQDALLSAEREKKGIVHANDLPSTSADERLVLWQGDITRLDADAIVNAANSQMLGCFVPCHKCIDNAIHSAAGLQLREECAQLMREQGFDEPTGQAKITRGYNLPAKYVLHTVGPIIHGTVTEHDRELLASCYRSCLKLAAKKGLESVAFCCISTGEYYFPKQEAAQIAVKTVKAFLQQNTTIRKVIFNVHSQQNYEIYRKLLG